MPRRPNPRQPLINYLGVQRRVDRELNAVLRQAARDAEQRVRALELGPQGIGSRVRRAQLLGVLGAIRRAQEELWLQGVGPLITRSLRDAQLAAILAAETLDSVLFEALPEYQAEALRQSVRATAEAGMHAEAARQARELSPRVWNNAALASGQIERKIRSGIVQGLSARELARDVRVFVDPATPGGASYAAKRLARTELNNAFHNQQIASADKPWVTGVKWNLSESHPTPDECDQYARTNAHGLGIGVFPRDDVPGKPHPQCLCFMTYETMDEDDFIDNLVSFVNGDQSSPIRA